MLVGHDPTLSPCPFLKRHVLKHGVYFGVPDLARLCGVKGKPPGEHRPARAKALNKHLSRPEGPLIFPREVDAAFSGCTFRRKLQIWGRHTFALERPSRSRWMSDCPAYFTLLWGMFLFLVCLLCSLEFLMRTLPARTPKIDEDRVCRRSIWEVGLDLARRVCERAELYGVQQCVFQDVRPRGRCFWNLVGTAVSFCY